MFVLGEVYDFSAHARGSHHFRIHQILRARISLSPFEVWLARSGVLDAAGADLEGALGLGHVRAVVDLADALVATAFPDAGAAGIHVAGC